MPSRVELVAALQAELCVDTFNDYCPNGLQVQGRDTIQRILSGVTASKKLLDEAIAWQADAVLVHHGYFWRGESEAIVGMKYHRIKALLDHDINLLAYHLPLDAHPQLGNNAQLGKLLGFEDVTYLSPSDKTLGFKGRLSKAMPGSELALKISQCLGRQVTHIDVDRAIQSVAWCTGAGQRFIDIAAEAGVDAFISGEISEPTAHSAREQQLHYFAAGHHATERYGVQALGEWLASKFALTHRFYDDDNPA